MKITYSTPERLVIDHVPKLMSIGLALMVVLFIGIGLLPLGFSDEPMMWLFSFMFIVVGGGLWLMSLELFARRLQIVLDRGEDRITIRRRSIFSRKQRDYTLSALVDAEIDRSRARPRDRHDSKSPDLQTGGLERPVLLLRGKDGDIMRAPVHDYYTSGPRPRAICEAINTWLGAGASEVSPQA